MKVSRLFIVLAIVIASLGYAQSASAGAFTYTSAYQVQNLEATTASIQIDFYNQDGTTATGTVSDTISANGSKTYFVVTQLTGSFNGSIVISSTTRVASIANVHGDNYFANASYVGFTAGSNTVQIPLLMKGNSGFNTWYNLQNTSSSDATVNVTYTDGTSVGPYTIKPGASRTFDQATETHTMAIFAATVTSNQPIAATVIEENILTMFAYNGFPAGSPNPRMPLVNANNSGYTTGISLYNLGGTSTDVTISYDAALAGTDCTETHNVPANSFALFALDAFASGASSTCAAGATFIGAGEVTSNSAGHDLVAVVNQHILGKNGEAYGGFDPSIATSTVVFPLIMDRNSGWWTGFSVTNVGASAANVTCTFTGTTYTASDSSLAPGESLVDLQNGAISSGYIGSATCVDANGGLIVGIVNELQDGGASDQFMVYEGINTP